MMIYVVSILWAEGKKEVVGAYTDIDLCRKAIYGFESDIGGRIAYEQEEECVYSFFTYDALFNRSDIERYIAEPVFINAAF